MTLLDYLKLCEEQHTHVLVDVGDGISPPVEEVHPIPKEALPIMQTVWANTYYQHQANLGAAAKLGEGRRHAINKRRDR